MIVVTGATGALNGRTVEHLADRIPLAEIAVVTRDPVKAKQFADRGIEVRYGDYALPSSLPAALAGADQLLLVSSNDPSADAVALHRNAIEAAVAAGTARVLYTSHQGAAADNPFGPGRDHAATEAMLAESGIAWTSLRNGFYAHSLDWLTGPWRETGVITIPLDGPVSWTAREDAAEAAAVILTSDDGYDGPVTLTAAAAPTFADIATIASDLIGHSVTLSVIDPQRWVSEQIAARQPEFVARFLLGIFQAAHQGFFAGTDPLLGNLLGREPATARDALNLSSTHD